MKTKRSFLDRLRSSIDHITEGHKNCEADSGDAYVLLSSLADTADFTLEHYEMVCKTAWELYEQAEIVREESLLEKILSGEVASSAELRLRAYVDLNLGYEDDEKAHQVEMKAILYRDFLLTEYWKLVRDVAIYRAHGRCQLCGKAAPFNVHHRSYEHHGMEHKHFEDLICLCRNCHAKFHDKLPAVRDARQGGW